MTAVLLLAFILSGVLANWIVETFGIVPVFPGLEAPAAVYVVGLALVLRDLLHERTGWRLVMVAILVGAVLSALFVDRNLALASGLAFLVSETADLLVYAPLRERALYGALVASNLVGAVVDSVVFLTIAFGGLAFLPGQVVGKVLMSLVAVAALALIRKHRWAPAT